MKKDKNHNPLSSKREYSAIRLRETECRGEIEAVLTRIYLLSGQYEEPDHPPLALHYMVDDYWELLLQVRS